MNLNWTIAKLEDVADILDSQRVPVNAKEREGRQGNVPYYGATGQVGWIDDFLFDEDLVLLGEDGAPFFDSSKQKAYIIRGKSWVNNHAHVLRTKAGIPSAYLKYLLDIVDYHGFVTGTTRAKLNQTEMRRIPVPLAPLNEQTRIVAEIEKQFSRLDEAVANLKRVKANLKRYKAAVLKAAVEGKLTEEWRRGAIHRAQQSDDQGANQGAMNCAPTETGAELLERILAERRKGAGKGKYKEPVGPDTSGLPELPVGWVWASLDSLIVNGPQNGLYLPNSFYGSGHPILRINDYQQDWIRPKTELQRVSAKPEDVETYSLRAGDIVINRVNSPSHLGKVAVWTGLGQGPVFESNMMRLELASNVLPLFVAHYLRSEGGRTRLTKQAKWAVNQASINQQDVCQTPVPLPPLAEQHQIVAEVERRLSIVAGAEAQVDANLCRAERLRQSILKQAFSGQLVPQDPNDEPASVLLERIRANANVGARFIAPKTRPEKPRRAQSIAPLQKSETAPVASDDFYTLDSVLAAILGRMQPGREYARAELADPLDLSTARWNAAIQELKRRGKVRQVGERRGARYALNKTAGGGV